MKFFSITFSKWVFEFALRKEQWANYSYPFVEQTIYYKPSISRKRAKMKWLSKLEEVLIRFICKTFSKLLFTIALRKEQRSAPFVEHHVHSLLAAKQGRENKTFKQLPVSTNGIHQYDFLKAVALNRSTKGTMTGSLL